ncbi:hypothetical protein ACFQYP_21650 [Nonomuraea antimicrobica]
MPGLLVRAGDAAAEPGTDADIASSARATSSMAAASTIRSDWLPTSVARRSSALRMRFMVALETTR